MDKVRGVSLGVINKILKQKKGLEKEKEEGDMSSKWSSFNQKQ